MEKHRSVFQEHVKYIHNDIVKPLRFVILHYSERVHEMHNLEKYLPSILMKVVGTKEAGWDIYEKVLNEYFISVATKYGVPASMQDELEDNK